MFLWCYASVFVQPTTTDEATSALDSGSEASVQQALAELHAETRMTMIIVAHRLSTVQVQVALL
jgi:ABC-type multidrug transport system fused ATPase/permease subunit